MRSRHDVSDHFSIQLLKLYDVVEYPFEGSPIYHRTIGTLADLDDLSFDEAAASIATRQSRVAFGAPESTVFTDPLGCVPERVLLPERTR